MLLLHVEQSSYQDVANLLLDREPVLLRCKYRSIFGLICYARRPWISPRSLTTQDNTSLTNALHRSPVGIFNEVNTYSLNCRHILSQDDLESTICYCPKMNHACDRFRVFISRSRLALLWFDGEPRARNP